MKRLLVAALCCAAFLGVAQTARSGFQSGIVNRNLTPLDLVAFDGNDVAVAEPAIWAIMIAGMIAGFGFAVAAMRRRQKVQAGFG